MTKKNTDKENSAGPAESAPAQEQNEAPVQETQTVNEPENVDSTEPAETAPLESGEIVPETDQEKKEDPNVSPR